jgi:hypothetical protein
MAQCDPRHASARQWLAMDEQCDKPSRRCQERSPCQQQASELAHVTENGHVRITTSVVASFLSCYVHSCS